MVGTSDGSGRGQDDDRNVARAGAFGRRSFLKGAAAGAGAVGFHLGGLAIAAERGAQRDLDRERQAGDARRASGTRTRTPSIEGFATDISVNAGETVSFKVATDATAYRIRIYRMGWYQGHGARRVAEILPSAAAAAGPARRRSPTPTSRAGLRPASSTAATGRCRPRWQVPANAVSGVYFANFERLDRPGHHQPGDVRGAQRRSRRPTCWCRRRTRRCTPTTAGAATACTTARRSAGRSRSATTGRSASTATATPSGTPSTPSCGGSSATATTSPTRPASTPTGGAASCSTTRSFVSSGHDEYWSAAQRANVEAGPRRRRPPRVHGRQRGVLEDPLGGEQRPVAPPPAAPSSATRRRSPGPSSTPPPSGRARGATPGSARRPTAAGPSSRSSGRSSAPSTTRRQPDLTIRVPAAVRGAAVLAPHRRGLACRPGRPPRLTAGHARLRVGRRPRGRAQARRSASS